MDMSNEKRCNSEMDIVEAQSHVWNHSMSSIHSMTLRCAIQLGIPDIIHRHGHPMTLSELVSGLSIHPNRSNFIKRLMRILIHSGFFALDKEEEQDEGYVLTLPSRLVLKENPLNVSTMMLLMSDPIFIDPFELLSKWLQDDKVSTPFMEKNKQDIWNYVDQHPETDRLFNDAMAWDGPLVADAIINKCRGLFDGATSLVDVGGGTGGLARAIAAEFLHLDCTVFDLAHVVKGLTGDQENLKFEDGDMFVSTDIVLLKWIMHCWSDEKSIEILRNCRKAITHNGNMGKVVIIDT